MWKERRPWEENILGRKKTVEWYDWNVIAWRNLEVCKSFHVAKHFNVLSGHEVQENAE